ncbi:hypothetical protein EV193_11632 [Herbihabitans rhizosphaerae]|uniref:Uncharacterized protein n=1 Tax=Herbihabitans rhizosphaerae TaxID=1872711 RepID=A0A4V2ERD9_9PSEU|nr:hypothetical protein EV193_11632 [Herbihabitans rhizosphaerae]
MRFRAPETLRDAKQQRQGVSPLNHTHGLNETGHNPDPPASVEEPIPLSLRPRPDPTKRHLLRKPLPAPVQFVVTRTHQLRGPLNTKVTVNPTPRLIECPPLPHMPRLLPTNHIPMQLGTNTGTDSERTARHDQKDQQQRLHHQVPSPTIRGRERSQDQAWQRRSQNSRSELGRLTLTVLPALTRPNSEFSGQNSSRMGWCDVSGRTYTQAITRRSGVVTGRGAT